MYWANGGRRSEDVPLAGVVPCRVVGDELPSSAAYRASPIHGWPGLSEDLPCREGDDLSVRGRCSAIHGECARRSGSLQSTDAIPLDSNLCNSSALPCSLSSNH